MIYVAEILDLKFVKIGFSANESPMERLLCLQTGNPFQIKFLFAVPGTIYQEQALHASLRVAFARVRIPMPPNEWYPGRNDFFRKFLAELRFGMDAGLLFCEKYNPAIKQEGKKSNDVFLPNLKWPILQENQTPPVRYYPKHKKTG